MTTLPKLKLRREDLKPGDCLCDHCSAKCCKYFALAIDKPEDREEFEYIRWFLMHDQASIFTEDDTWYLLVGTTCQHLQPDNRCGIYTTRPQICRDYSTEDCEYEDSWVYERFLETSEQVAEYAEAVLWRPGTEMRSPKPALLPVLQ